jgi:hypothetical protein
MITILPSLTPVLDEGGLGGLEFDAWLGSIEAESVVFIISDFEVVAVEVAFVFIPDWSLDLKDCHSWARFFAWALCNLVGVHRDCVEFSSICRGDLVLDGPIAFFVPRFSFVVCLGVDETESLALADLVLLNDDDLEVYVDEFGVWTPCALLTGSWHEC